MESGISESQLVYQAKEGCNRSFDALVELYKPFLGYKTKVYYLEGSDKGDVYQECLIGLHKAVRDFDLSKKCGFKTFARLCIDRHLVSSIKSANRDKHKILNWSKNLPDSESCYLIDHEADPYNILITREKLSILSKRLKELLSNTEKMTLRYHYQGFTYIQISSKIGMSEKSVDNALQRAREKIQRALEATN